MPFEFYKLEIPDLILIKPKVFCDDRGFFLESYKKSEFNKAGIREDFVQDNHSKSKKNVLRGIHFQLNPKAQGKLVRCIKGKIFDVAVDLRKNSKTFKKWIGIELSEENKLMLYIPPGFGHAFLTLSDEAEVIYKTTAEYDRNLDSGIRWNDPSIGITWGIKNPILSEKDANLPFLKDSNLNFN